MDFTILLWNIRGAVNRRGKRRIKEIVRNQKPSLIILVETHTVFSSVDRFWNNLGYSLMACEEASGHAGGIWILSSTPTLNCQIVDSMHQAISFLVGDGDDSWVCTAAYASPTPIVRSSFWSYLVELRSRVSKPWMLIGDFNEVLLASECKGGSFVHSRARLFQDCLNACNLSDVKVVGSGFTWQRSRHGQPTILKKLDRVVADMG